MHSPITWSLTCACGEAIQPRTPRCCEETFAAQARAREHLGCGHRVTLRITVAATITHHAGMARVAEQITTELAHAVPGAIIQEVWMR